MRLSFESVAAAFRRGLLGEEEASGSPPVAPAPPASLAPPASPPTPSAFHTMPPTGPVTPETRVLHIPSPAAVGRQRLRGAMESGAEQVLEQERAFPEPLGRSAERREHAQTLASQAISREPVERHMARQETFQPTPPVAPPPTLPERLEQAGETVRAALPLFDPESGMPTADVTMAAGPIAGVMRRAGPGRRGAGALEEVSRGLERALAPKPAPAPRPPLVREQQAPTEATKSLRALGREAGERQGLSRTEADRALRDTVEEVTGKRSTEKLTTEQVGEITQRHRAKLGEPPEAAVPPAAHAPTAPPRRTGPPEPPRPPGEPPRQPPRPPGPPGPPEPPGPPGPPESPTPDDFLNFRRVGISEPEKDNLRRLIQQQIDTGLEKTSVPFEQIRQEAADLDPAIVTFLKKPGKGETLRPEVRLAARERLNAINDDVTRLTQRLEQERNALLPDQREALSSRIEALESDAKGLLDVLIPTRSQDGRNLAYHRIMAEKSFDHDYWIARARKKFGGALPDEVEKEIGVLLSQARQAGTAGDAAALSKAQRNLARVFMGLERTGFLDTINALRRAGLLTGMKTHLRNLFGNLSHQALNEISRAPASIADIAMSVVSGERTVAGPSLRAVARAGREAAVRSPREMGQIMRHGATESELARMDVYRPVSSTLFGGGTRADDLVNAYTNTVFNTMAAGDRPFRIAAARRSLDAQADVIARNEARAGKIPRSAIRERARALADNPTAVMKAQAMADSEVAVFANRSPMTEAISSFRRKLGSGGRFLFDLAIPFQRTPTNIVHRLLEFGGVNPKAARAAAQSVVERSLTPERQKIIAEAVGKGLTGHALILLGYWLATEDQMTGVSPPTPGERNVREAAGQLNGAVRVGDRWHKISDFSPAGNLLTIGATLHHEERKTRTPAERLGAGVGIAGKTALEQPLFTGARLAVRSLEDPESIGEQALSRTLGSFVPTAVADVARLQDPARREIRGQGVTGSLQERLPFARSRLPQRHDVLGRPQFSPPHAAVLPTIGTQARDEPLVRELTRLGLPLSFPRPITSEFEGGEETPEELRRRGRFTGQMLEQVLSEYVRSPEYQELSDEEKRERLSDEIARVRGRITPVFSRDVYRLFPPEVREEVAREMAEGVSEPGAYRPRPGIKPMDPDAVVPRGMLQSPQEQ